MKLKLLGAFVEVIGIAYLAGLLSAWFADEHAAFKHGYDFFPWLCGLAVVLIALGITLNIIGGV